MPLPSDTKTPFRCACTWPAEAGVQSGCDPRLWPRCQIKSHRELRGRLILLSWWPEKGGEGVRKEIRLHGRGRSRVAQMPSRGRRSKYTPLLLERRPSAKAPHSPPSSRPLHHMQHSWPETGRGFSVGDKGEFLPSPDPHAKVSREHSRPCRSLGNDQTTFLH